jgi:hypothetical protein
MLILAWFDLLCIIKTVAIRSRGTVPLLNCAQVDADPGPVRPVVHSDQHAAIRPTLPLPTVS